MFTDETLLYRLDLESVSASPTPPSRRSSPGVTARLFPRNVDAVFYSEPFSGGGGELWTAMFDRLATGGGGFLGERRR